MKTFIRKHAVTLVGLAVAAWLVLHGHHVWGLLAMAYPTTLAFKGGILPIIGMADILLTDTTQRHPIGFLAYWRDPTYGIIECIYLPGVAATAQGDIVIYDVKNQTTTRAVAASRGPAAVAMSANVAGQFGWYAVWGVVPGSTTLAGTGAANDGLCTTAVAGQATVGGTASQKIDGMRCKSVQDAPGVGFTDVELAYPACNNNT